jgi:hypothetical protein
MSDFAKLLTLPDVGQVWVKIARGDDGGDPEVRFYCQPKGWGVLSLAMKFSDDDKGWDAAEAAFARADEAIARKVVDTILGTLGDAR